MKVTKTTQSIARSAMHVSKRLVASYIIDWILILWVHVYNCTSRPRTDLIRTGALSQWVGASQKLMATDMHSP
jgi:hypothetical protein